MIRPLVVALYKRIVPPYVSTRYLYNYTYLIGLCNPVVVLLATDLLRIIQLYFQNSYQE